MRSYQAILVSAVLFFGAVFLLLSPGYGNNIGSDLVTLQEDFRSLDDGTVVDINRGLLWQRCSRGQSYADRKCVGAPEAVAIAMAGYHCSHLELAGRKWRLPADAELKILYSFIYYYQNLPPEEIEVEEEKPKEATETAAEATVDELLEPEEKAPEEEVPLFPEEALQGDYWSGDSMVDAGGVWNIVHNFNAGYPLGVKTGEYLVRCVTDF